MQASKLLTLQRTENMCLMRSDRSIQRDIHLRLVHHVHLLRFGERQSLT